MDTDVQDFASLIASEKTIGHDGPQAKECEGALCVKSIDIEKRQVRVLASSDNLDRYEERMLPSAFKNHLGLYRSNPVVLAAHQHKLGDGKPPVIGKTVKIWIDRKGLWAVIEFARTALAEEYWQLYRDGYMKAVSVGFRPIPNGSHYETEAGGRRILVWDEVELLEISCCAVPANPQALVRSKQQKQDFVNAKKQDRRREYLQSLGVNPDTFDAECEEFAEAITSGKIYEGDFAGIVNGDDATFIDLEIEEDEFFDETELSVGDNEPDYAALI
jgi:HK97 family phage prohead protease